MSSPVLHIKDAYFFEVPKALWPAHYTGKSSFPAVWVRLDPDFQLWEAKQLHEKLFEQSVPGLPEWNGLRAAYEEWKHDQANFGKPLAVMLEEHHAKAKQQYTAWKQASPEQQNASFGDFLDQTDVPYEWFCRVMDRDSFASAWRGVKERAGDLRQYAAQGAEWPAEKIAAYNKHLSGKILIPQPCGRLRNLYEPESGFCISKFMWIEVFVALILLAVFAWVGRKAKSGGAPRGRLWNLLEMFLVYLRDKVARPAIGEHDVDRFVPLLWTIFMFVLSCNLCGMVPWVGAPTSAFGVTTGLAVVTFGTGVLCGVIRLGPWGYVANLIPHMHLPFPMGLVIKPMLFAIELLGLCIKHMVLAIRLLANMVAGHLVLLGVMGLAFGASAAAAAVGQPDWKWGLSAVIAIIGATLLSLLELLVAFLQAYIFTFLSALFIGAAIHHH